MACVEMPFLKLVPSSFAFLCLRARYATSFKNQSGVIKEGRIRLGMYLVFRKLGNIVTLQTIYHPSRSLKLCWQIKHIRCMQGATSLLS